MIAGTSGLTTEERAETRTAQSEASAPAAQQGHSDRLLHDTGHFRERWNAIQGAFVDEPRRAVEHADALVAAVIHELARVFANEQRRLESTWSSGGEVNTEDLRLTLQRYRDFFRVLLRD